MEDIFESLRSMDWNFQEIKNNSKKSCNFVSYGPNNPMFGLKGENHPSHHWHKNIATKEYYEKKKKGVMESWMNNEVRKRKHSQTMKDKWLNGKITPEMAKKNGQHGLKGKDIHNTLEIEYKNVIYYGWRELKEKTGVSKSLYNKYYMNGIDPESRIGSNGPKPKTLIMEKMRKEVSV